MTGEQETKRQGRPSTATSVLNAAKRAGAEVFSGELDGRRAGFILAPVEGRSEVHRLDSQACRRWLAGTMYRLTGAVPSAQAAQDAAAVLAAEAEALPGRPVAVRVARSGGEVWVDLGGPDRRCVEVGPAGWTVREQGACPVLFVRSESMVALPEPVPGGDWAELRAALALPDDAWQKVMGFALAAFSPGVPAPVLAVHGTHGSGKSLLCRRLVALLDPQLNDLSRPPTSERDLFVGCGGRRVLALDNVSGLTEQILDALCVVATGGALTLRKLYSDADVAVVRTQRAILLNGIPTVARSDLADRSLVVELPPREAFGPEAVLWGAWRALLPRALGLLLGALSASLRGAQASPVEGAARMADFLALVNAAEAEGGLPWAVGSFERMYRQARADVARATVEGSTLAGALVGLADDLRGATWEGTPGRLFELLNEQTPPDLRRGDSGWPRSPRGLRAICGRLLPDLRAVGVRLDLQSRVGHERKGLIRLWRAGGAGCAGGSETATTRSEQADQAQESDECGRCGRLLSSLEEEEEREAEPAERPLPPPNVPHHPRTPEAAPGPTLAEALDLGHARAGRESELRERLRQVQARTGALALYRPSPALRALREAVCRALEAARGVAPDLSALGAALDHAEALYPAARAGCGT